MSTQDNLPEDEIGADELSALYRKAEDAAPPTALDQTILAAAKRAVEDKTASHRSSRSPFSGHWPVATSAAAVIVIAIMLVPLLERQTPMTESTPPTENTPSSTINDLFNTNEQAEAKKAVRERLPASNPGRLYAPPPARTQSLQQHSVLKQPDMDADREIATGRSITAAPSAVIQPESQERRAQARLDAASGAPLAIFTPEMWLVKIQRLIDSGKIREAGDEFDKFRRAHPDYELDQNLLEQLKQP